MTLFSEADNFQDRYLFSSLQEMIVMIQMLHAKHMNNFSKEMGEDKKSQLGQIKCFLVGVRGLLAFIWEQSIDGGIVDNPASQKV